MPWSVCGLENSLRFIIVHILSVLLIPGIGLFSWKNFWQPGQQSVGICFWWERISPTKLFIYYSVELVCEFSWWSARERGYFFFAKTFNPLKVLLFSIILPSPRQNILPVNPRKYKKGSFFLSSKNCWRKFYFSALGLDGKVFKTGFLEEKRILESEPIFLFFICLIILIL